MIPDHARRDSVLKYAKAQAEAKNGSWKDQMWNIWGMFGGRKNPAKSQ